MQLHLFSDELQNSRLQSFCSHPFSDRFERKFGNARPNTEEAKWIQDQCKGYDCKILATVHYLSWTCTVVNPWPNISGQVFKPFQEWLQRWICCWWISSNCSRGGCPGVGPVGLQRSRCPCRSPRGGKSLKVGKKVVHFPSNRYVLGTTFLTSGRLEISAEADRGS